MGFRSCEAGLLCRQVSCRRLCSGPQNTGLGKKKKKKKQNIGLETANLCGLDVSANSWCQGLSLCSGQVGREDVPPSQGPPCLLFCVEAGGQSRISEFWAVGPGRGTGRGVHLHSIFSQQTNQSNKTFRSFKNIK